jgi:NtrC-family two-component system response regulator AlgB
LTLKPLRERPEDIVPLAQQYFDVFSRKQQRSGLSFSPAAEQALQRHRWPGNRRELRNAVERAVIVASDQRLEPGDLGLEVDHPSEARWIRVNTIGELVPLGAIEREHVARVIARSPSLEAAARTLGIDATTLQRKRRRFGLA